MSDPVQPLRGDTDAIRDEFVRRFDGSVASAFTLGAELIGPRYYEAGIQQGRREAREAIEALPTPAATIMAAARRIIRADALAAIDALPRGEAR